MNVVEGRWSTTQQEDSLRESSGVKRSPEFMSSVVMSTSNSSAGKEGTGRLLGLVIQQVELGQWAPDSSGRHCFKNKRQTCIWKLIREVDLWALPTPPYKCINTYACYSTHVYTDSSTCTWRAYTHTSEPPHMCTSTCTHTLIHTYEPTFSPQPPQAKTGTEGKTKQIRKLKLKNSLESQDKKNWGLMLTFSRV